MSGRRSASSGRNSAPAGGGAEPVRRTPEATGPASPASYTPRSGSRGAGTAPARTSARTGGSAVPVADDAGSGTRVMPATARRSSGGRQATGSAHGARNTGGPGGPTRPGDPLSPDDQPSSVPTRRRRHRGRRIALTLVMLLVLAIAWPVGLVIWANGKVQHVDALSGATGTPGETYLLTGSDSREDGAIEDPETVGARTDTILLLQVPESGPTALISLPRDSYVDIPGHGKNKLNAAFSWGGAPLLVQTVEQLTGLTVDHYVEIGFGGVEQVVDAAGGVELCLDDSVLTFPIHDTNSGLNWEAPGCQTVDGATALAFSRMRYSDPTGDIGRGQRQRQLISAVTSAVATPASLVNPGRQIRLIDAGTGAMTTSTGTGVVDLAKLALAFRSASGENGITGTPPIDSLDYRPGGGVGSTVLLDEDRTPSFFTGVRDGTLAPGVYGGTPG